jgi:hypothetical protein
MDFYYSARSEVALEAACEALSEAFALPAFTYDTHDTWRYAWSSGDHLRLNVTRTKGSRTIETWMPNCPRGVNYQIILTAACEPPSFVSLLAAILDAAVARYDTRPASEHDEGGSRRG